MAHLDKSLPGEVEIGAQREIDWNTEVTPLDSGGEIRNNPWDAPRKTYNVSFPVSERDSSLYEDVLDLYEEAEGSLHSFKFKDWATGETIAVRFDSALRTVGVTPELEQIVGVTLVEVFLDTEDEDEEE